MGDFLAHCHEILSTFKTGGSQLAIRLWSAIAKQMVQIQDGEVIGWGNQANKQTASFGFP